MTFRQVLVPVDYSEPSQRALKLALTLAGEVKLVVVHAWDRPAYVSEEMIAYKDGSRRSLSELIRENAEKEMADFLAGVPEAAGKKVEHRLLNGEPVSVILEEASKP